MKVRKTEIAMEIALKVTQKKWGNNRKTLQIGTKWRLLIENVVRREEKRQGNMNSWLYFVEYERNSYSRKKYNNKMQFDPSIVIGQLLF